MWINIQLNGIHTIHKTNGKKISFHSIPFNSILLLSVVCLWTMIFVFYIYFHIYNDNVLFFISFSLFVWYTHKQTKTNTVYIGLRPKKNSTRNGFIHLITRIQKQKKPVCTWCWWWWWSWKFGLIDNCQLFRSHTHTCST